MCIYTTVVLQGLGAGYITIQPQPYHTYYVYTHRDCKLSICCFLVFLFNTRFATCVVLRADLERRKLFNIIINVPCQISVFLSPSIFRIHTHYTCELLLSITADTHYISRCHADLSFRAATPHFLNPTSSSSVGLIYFAMCSWSKTNVSRLFRLFHEMFSTTIWMWKVVSGYAAHPLASLHSITCGAICCFIICSYKPCNTAKSSGGKMLTQ